MRYRPTLHWSVRALFLCARPNGVRVPCDCTIRRTMVISCREGETFGNFCRAEEKSARMLGCAAVLAGGMYGWDAGILDVQRTWTPSAPAQL